MIIIIARRIIRVRSQQSTHAFPPENEEISTPPPCGLLIGIYIFSFLSKMLIISRGVFKNPS